MRSLRAVVRRIARKWPGERYLGDYRFMPLFFVAGAVLEFCMINWHAGEVNFYQTYKQRKVENAVEWRLMVYRKLREKETGERRERLEGL